MTSCLVEIYGGHGGDHGCVFIRGSKERWKSGYMELQNMFVLMDIGNLRSNLGIRTLLMGICVVL